MSSTIARCLVAIAAVLVMRSVLYGSGGGDIPPMQPQKCNDAVVEYTAPAGHATGTGTSGQNARSNASSNMTQAVELSVNPCAICPDGDECEAPTSYSWNNPQWGTPVYDPILGLWTVSVSWDGCTIRQRCRKCD